MLKRSLLLIVALLLIPAGSALAQGGGEPGGTRLVCVTGFGCGFTPLSDEGLETFFGDEAILESEGDYIPTGAWEIAYDPAEMICGSMTIPVAAETQSLVLTPAEDITAGGILVEGVEGADAMFLDRLGPGVFTASITLEQDGGAVHMSYFLVMTSEATLEGMVLGTVDSPSSTCLIDRPFFGAGQSVEME